jgi:archaellum component FlaF (FlaF/FlaG flagellin family)
VVNNQSGTTITIESITLTWNNQGNRALKAITLDSTNIFNGTDSDGTYVSPSLSKWSLAPGQHTFTITYSKSTSGSRMLLTFVETSCSPVDSDS